MKDKYLVLIRGLSGSGKTTLADIICGEDDSKISISVDDYFYDEDGNYTFNSADLKTAHKWCYQEVHTCMSQGFSVVAVHNTFTRAWEIEKYFELATQHNYKVIVPDLYNSGLNDATLSSRSPHGVSIFNIRKQRKRWESDVFNPER
jgi:predicted kinase